jgi:acetoin utilization deacetylase AcuC-like enzyme
VHVFVRRPPPHKIDEAVDAFVPELILLSAGFDAHINDPLGSKAFVGGGKYSLAPIGRLSSDDFFDVVSRVVNLANRHCMGRLVAVMEGGYCCRPPAASSSSSATSTSAPGAKSQSQGEEEEEGDSSDNDVTDPSAVAKETIRDCVAATCRALGGVERKGEGRE